MTGRIRWVEALDGEALGCVGTLDCPVFRLWGPDEDGDRLLFAYLCGHAGDLYHGTTAVGQKDVAERLLAEFAASFGAVFPDAPGRWAALRDQITRDAATEQELGDGYGEMGTDLSQNSASKHWDRAGALREVMATMDRMEAGE